MRALKLGAFDFISKPLDITALRKLITATLKLGETPESTTQLPQVKLLGRSRHRAAARNDRACRPQPGAGTYIW